MNKILTIFFVGITLVTFAGEIYYGVDKNGNMFMSDRPLPTEIKEDPNSFGKKNPLEQAEIKRKNQEVEKQNKEVKRKAEDRVRQIKITNQMEQKQMAEEEKIAPDNIKIEARGVHNNYRSLDQFLKKYPKYAYLIGVKMLFFIKEGKFESTVSWASKCFSELNFDPSQKKEYLVFLVDLLPGKTLDMVEGGVRGRRPREKLINIVDEPRRFVVAWNRRDVDGRLQQIFACGVSL